MVSGWWMQSWYEGVQTVVRTTEGDSKAFNVKVGLHQASVLSPVLFVIVMEIITRELRAGWRLELLYADDLILMAESVNVNVNLYSASSQK